jgi:hypothetical protein
MEKIKPWEYIYYTIGKTEIIVSGPPRTSLGKEMPQSLKVDAILSLTEDYIPPYWKDAKYQWSPWDESSEVPNNSLLSSMLILHDWIDKQNLNRIVIHCHGGTHRAPTILGLYTLAYHTKDFRKIAKTAKTYNNNPTYNWQNHPNLNFHTSIRSLVLGKLSMFPYLKKKLKGIVNGDFNRLDYLNSAIIDEENLSIIEREELITERIRFSLLSEASQKLNDYKLVNKNLTHADNKVDTFVLMESDNYFPENFVFNFREKWDKIIIISSNYSLIGKYLPKLKLLYSNEKLKIYTLKRDTKSTP